MTRTPVYLVILVLLLIGAAGCGSNGNGQKDAASTPTREALPSPTPSIPDGVVHVINRDQGGSGEYRFDPSEFRFGGGQEVTFALTAETEFHTFTVDELGIDVSIDAGETVLFTFTFDMPGTYELICIPHQNLGMVGEIVVEAKDPNPLSESRNLLVSQQP